MAEPNDTPTDAEARDSVPLLGFTHMPTGGIASPLVEFLLARIAEAERSAQAAKDATSGRWTASGSLILELHEQPGRVPLADPAIMSTEDYQLDGILEHVALHDPDRVLAECQAKRRIVERHDACGAGDGYCDDGGHGWDDEGGPRCSDLADLASAFADHADFDPAWRL